MKNIMIATHNMGKFEEIENFFKRQLPNIKITNMKEENLISPEETGSTFIENALIKAKYGSEASGLACIADDSGLVVETLAGEPGVYSSRFAGANANDMSNLNLLLEKIQASQENIHPAHYHCTLVFIKHPKDPDPIIAQSRWHGQICLEPKGTGGFGYDPIFYDPTLGCTAAELDTKTKNKMSHRGRALHQLINDLEKLEL